MSQCSIKNCRGSVHARSWCLKHYARWQRNGDPEKLHQPRGAKEEAAKILSRPLSFFPKTKCVTEWSFSRRPQGYPAFWQDKNFKLLHRLMCIKHHGEPSSKRVDCAHSCNNPHCYNPHHLRWATRSENMSDRQDAGTWGRVLNAVQVAGIYADPRPTKQVAETYKTTQATVNRIKSGTCWKHVSDWLESH